MVCHEELFSGLAIHLESEFKTKFII